MEILKTIMHLTIIMVLTAVITISIGLFLVWITGNVQILFCVLLFGSVAVAGWLGFFKD